MFEKLRFLWIRHRTYDYLHDVWRDITTIDGNPNLVIKRRFQPAPTYVDLYWIIKEIPADGHDTKKRHTVSRRCSWEMAKKTIQMIEEQIAKGEAY